MALLRLDRRIRSAYAARLRESSRFSPRASSITNWIDLASGDLRTFLLERIEYYFKEIRGYKYDEVKAVLASGVTTVADVEARLKAIAAVRSTEDFEPLAASFKRISNILKQPNFTPSGPVQASLLEEGPEAELAGAFETVCSEVRGAGYEETLLKVATLRPQVDLFFDKVLVNAPDAKVRANRLTLLSALLDRIFDDRRLLGNRHFSGEQK